MKPSGRQNRTLPLLKARISINQGRKVGSTPMIVLTNVGITENRNDQHGKTFVKKDGARKLGARPPTTLRDRPRASSLTNDSYCINSLTRRLLAGSTVHRKTDTFVNLNVVPRVHTAPGHSQKKEISPGAAVCFSQSNYKIKSVKLASCVTPLSCVKSVVNVRNAVTNPSVGTRLQKFWQVWWNLGASPKIVQILKEGYTLPFQNRPLLSRHPTVISRYVNHHRNSYLSEALHQLISKNAAERVQNPIISRVFQQTFPSAKTQQQMETHSRPKQTESFSQGGEIQDGNTGNHQNFPATRGMGHLNRLQRRLLPHTNTGTIQKISEISRPRSDIPIQGPALWSVHSTFGVHSGSQGSKANGHTQGYKDLPVPRQLVGESQVPPSLSPAYQGPAEIMPRPGLDSQLRKIRAGTETSLQLCRLPIRPQSWSGLTRSRTVAESQSKESSYASPTFLSGPTVHVLDSKFI